MWMTRSMALFQRQELRRLAGVDFGLCGMVLKLGAARPDCIPTRRVGTRKSSFVKF